MEEQLKNIFSNVNDWLKFAEAKNGILTGFNGGAVFTVLTAFLFNKDMAIIKNNFVKAYFTCFAICATLSLIIALVSFLAKIEIPWLFKAEAHPSGNLIFFGDIRKYTEKNYLDALKNALSIENKKPHTKMEEFYANQIIVNSKIAMQKNTLFNAALWFTISAIITPVLAIMLWAFLKTAN
ncbi:MAG: hypothetical protein GY795_31785 [Desulfobacterales bacterium]|nr:hypothetical protein [Desulfobacterales bacterium]